MDRLFTIQHKSKEVLVLDYSNLNEDEMIALLDSSIALVLEENRPTLVLSILKKNYVTPKYMRHFESELPKVEHLAERTAITGLSHVQLWILKAVNLWHKKQIHHFEKVDEAMDFLVEG